ncbi:MAG TPA: Ni/Fe-hydrogenase, b-type cytochrome subunit [Thermoanaerobaculia bacterium]|nr:Ni/Fe-hydrogenase, b-type cytochrome subunit [Thermoanaerobaculia bacterium]
MSTSAASLELPVPEHPGDVVGGTSPITREATDLARVYVWQIPVRITHWLIALSIFVLAATGFYIGHPFWTVIGQARQHFFTGAVRVVHLYAAIVFVLAVLSRIVWMFMGNRYASWRIFIPIEKKRARGIWPTLKFYLFGLRKPPGFLSHNPVAALAYSAIFCLYFLEIATGLALYSIQAPVGSPLHAFHVFLPVLGGAQFARWMHHVIMWLLLGFVVHHIYSGWLMSIVEGNGTMGSIFDGYKFVHREDLIHSGYRFLHRGRRID